MGAPLLAEYGQLPEPVAFGSLAVIVVVATKGRVSLRDDRRSQEPGQGSCPGAAHYT